MLGRRNCLVSTPLLLLLSSLTVAIKVCVLENDLIPLHAVDHLRDLTPTEKYTTDVHLDSRKLTS